MPFVVNFISVRFDPWITTDAVEQSHDVYYDQKKVRIAPPWMRLVYITHHQPKISYTEKGKYQKSNCERPRRTYLEKWPFAFLIA